MADTIKLLEKQKKVSTQLLNENINLNRPNGTSIDNNKFKKRIIDVCCNEIWKIIYIADVCQSKNKSMS